MKKILTMLTSFSLIATSSVLVVSCKTNSLKNKIEKPNEMPNINHNKEKNNPKTPKHMNEMPQGDQPGKQRENGSNQTQPNEHNKNNVLSSTEDERSFIYGYSKWLEDGKNGEAEHVINPEDPNEILLLGFSKEKKNNKEEYKLKEIPTNVNKVPKWIPTKVTSLEGAFKNNVNEIIDGIESWNTSNIKNMYQTFFGAKKFNTDISKWKTSKVENMNYMFAFAESFSKNLSKWDVKKTPYQSNFGRYSGFENQKDLWPPFINK
ncbi:BspA family leucine-rich repeat surface protein [Mycoplasma feriruminatoris]|uniref:BspA family leucine-rich repeat surface protein n=1 Tax=Mycoplasma feriruminatoris TaxID=1179777 RepID=UPI0002A4D64A|nr:BspA family leucine-rich repeat surface protein [Mycoplasma feriruminatoris]UKS54338.1 hypothetical protein D500_00694 [Mycoplasma feriruminatoris]VZK65516.1 hypothetical protein MF5292_00693 [Mycoplasma feriruminatoris]VZR75658.1 hypothetical protein MF5294_00690 [Mycoplasma feriruminatoris]VZR98211.1 hypothetical protein MF5293_00688 [Mycoplasma feriruminatoris]VZS00558.1 hypothetical protein MF5583_00665 [Mycoplasma feriruminatoris]